jgi:hypothetical protein
MATLPLLVSMNCVVPTAPMVSGGRKAPSRKKLSFWDVPSKPHQELAWAAEATAVSEASSSTCFVREVAVIQRSTNVKERDHSEFRSPCAPQASGERGGGLTRVSSGREGCAGRLSPDRPG